MINKYKEEIFFQTQPIQSERPEFIPINADSILIDSMSLNCFIINSHNIHISCSVSLNEWDVIPIIVEKFATILFLKIFNRIKQFIENSCI